MAIKIHLKKDYDRLKWDFVRETLVLAGFPIAFVDLIMNCIPSVSFQVLWNGEETGSFKPSRGIH